MGDTVASIVAVQLERSAFDRQMWSFRSFLFVGFAFSPNVYTGLLSHYTRNISELDWITECKIAVVINFYQTLYKQIMHDDI